MGTIAFGVISSSLLLLASAAPDRKITPHQTVDVSAKDSPDKMVCKKEETIGSRLAAKNVCLTEREWQQVADQSREHTEKIQSSVCVPARAACSSALRQAFGSACFASPQPFRSVDSDRSNSRSSSRIVNALPPS